MPVTCSACGYANREGALFCAGCGAELAVVCVSCGASLAEGARFCDACGAEVAASRAPSESRKVLTVVFADLVGSTALQERLDSESARQLMSRFYDAMRAVLEAEGGRLEKFIGDAVVAVFGLPALREDDALRAVRAAGAMSDALQTLNEELERIWGVRLQMRTGVNTGELVVSDAGVLVGDTMNTAARLEQAAPPGAVLVGQATWRLVHRSVGLEPVEPLELKGKAEPVPAWRLVSATVPGASASLEAPLVGRSAELATLRQAFEATVVAGQCRLVTVMGSPGVGKSRLAREFARSVPEPARVVEGHCEPTGEGITFLPVAEVLRVVAGIGEADPPELVREKLRGLTPEDDPDRDRLVERIAGVLGVAEPSSAQETFWALRRAIEFLARERTLVLILDDLHWGQPMLLDLVEHLVEWVRDAPVLILALARPELRDAREALASAGRGATDVIELTPLDDSESQMLVGGLLGEMHVPPELSARILETTEGNPLFLGETVRMLVDEGVIRREADRWVTVGDTNTVEVPPTIQALLATRIERLRDDERSVVERAAVIGKQFYRGAVAELVTPLVRTGIDGHLEALRRKDMVEPEGTYWIDEPVYRFHHVLIRDAAYRSLLKEARADLHERFADWLELKAGDLVGEHEEVIAFHLEQAHMYRLELGRLDDGGSELGARAARLLLSAGRRALAREDLAAAANLLGRALERESGDGAEILWDLCEAVLSAGDTAAAVGLVERFAQESAETPLSRARASVLECQLANLTGAGQIGATAEAAVAAAVTLHDLGDRAGEAKGAQVAAQAYARLGQVAAVEEALDRALASARSADDRRRVTAVLAAAPRAALWGPSPVVRASGRCLDVVRILRMTPGNRHVEAIALRCQAVLEAMRGRAEAAREILAVCRATLEELGLALELHETAVHAGIVELLADEPGAACDHLRTARAGFEALGVAPGAAQAAALLAGALVEQGGHDEAALEETRFAERHGGEDLKTTITWLSARAEALGRMGEFEPALDSARRAVALAEPTDALADKADALMSLARVLQAAGDANGAREQALAAAGWYEAKGHLVGVERAAKLAGERTVSAPEAATPGAVLGDRPPERLYAEFKRRFDAQDADALIELAAEDCVIVDHRAAGWEELRGRAAARRLHDSAVGASVEIRFEVDEVLACDDRVIAARIANRGRGRRAGEFEFRAGYVSVVEDGRWVSLDQYEYDDDAAMLARFAELTQLAPQRFRAEFKRRFDAHDVDGCIELTGEDWVQTDHRRVGWGRARGRERARELLESVYADAPDLRVEVSEVLACDDRVIAERGAWRGTTTDGGGEFEVPFGMVSVIEDGRRVSEDVYEPEDDRTIIARYVELGGGLSALGGRPPERWMAHFARVHADRELKALLALYGPAYDFTDHRQVGWASTTGHKDLEELVTTGWNSTTYMRLEVDEVLACDERVIAALITWHGGAVAEVGGGPWAFALGVVAVIENGLAGHWEHYEPDQCDAVLARYEWLRTQADNGPSDWLRRHDLLAESDDWDPLAAELIAPDVMVRDRRGFPTSDLRGPIAYRELMESAGPLGLLACDGELLVASSDDDPPLVLVAKLSDGKAVEAIVMRDQVRARAWLTALTRARAHEQFSDLDGLVATHHPESRIMDHRPLKFQDAADRRQIRKLYGTFAMLLDGARVSVEVLDVHLGSEVLAIAWHGTDRTVGGAVEWESFSAIRVRDNLYEEIHSFDDAAQARAKAEELSWQAPTIARRYIEAVNARDWEALAELYNADCAFAEHRRVGWQDFNGVDGLIAMFESTLDLASDVSVRGEVLRDTGGDLYLRQILTGTWEGGPWEVALDTISEVRDGRFSRIEQFDVDRRDELQARLAELRAERLASRASRNASDARPRP
jgi:class 3 adenylate cyclase/ketosteroid isomerase-like protein